MVYYISATTLFVLILLIPGASATALEKKVFLREEFDNLENWMPHTFPKINAHTVYAVFKRGSDSYLIAESSASASAIILKEKFDVYAYPKVRWRWRVSNVYEKGDARRKSGDDYPMRVYILFEYHPEAATFAQKAKYETARVIYGRYPPHSALNYIWASREDEEGVITNPYSDETKMLVLQKGNRSAGKWVEEERHILIDYRRAFGADPPRMATIGIMNDSDNTGEKSTSYMDYIEILR